MLIDRGYCMASLGRVGVSAEQETLYGIKIFRNKTEKGALGEKVYEVTGFNFPQMKAHCIKEATKAIFDKRSDTECLIVELQGIFAAIELIDELIEINGNG